MAYEMEDIRTGQEIFYYLLEHHELSEEAQERLFRSYAENERVQNLVKSQGEFTDGGFGMVEDNNSSLLAAVGSVVAFIFAPLGFEIGRAHV